MNEYNSADQVCFLICKGYASHCSVTSILTRIHYTKFIFWKHIIRFKKVLFHMNSVLRLLTTHASETYCAIYKLVQNNSLTCFFCISAHTQKYPSRSLEFEDVLTATTNDILPVIDQRPDESPTWPGRPEVISSIRRPKKSITQQNQVHALNRLRAELEELRFRKRLTKATSPPSTHNSLYIRPAWQEHADNTKHKWATEWIWWRHKMGFFY